MAKNNVKSLTIVDKAVKGFLWGSLIIYCISLLLTLGWVLFYSFNDSFSSSNGSLKIVFYNYVDAIVLFFTPKGRKSGYGLLDMLFYSLLYAGGTSFVTVSLYTMMGYVMAKYKFFGREALYAIGIFVMVTPIIGNTASMVQVREFFGIRDNMFLLILTSNSCAFSGLNFLLIHAACKRVPWDYAESAFIDGAGHVQVFLKIMLPMIMPSCAVVFVLMFLSVWNDYETFMVWLRFYPSLSLGLFNLYNRLQAVQNDPDVVTAMRMGTPTIMAAYVIAMIPTIALYLASQRLILDKFQVGGLKG